MLLPLLAPAVLVSAALACTCAEPRSSEIVLRAEAVFTGVAVYQTRSFRGPTTAFAVLRLIRGVPSRAVVEVDTSLSPCEADFRAGEAYLVFAAWSDGRPGSSACAGSRPLAFATEWLRYIDDWRRGRTAAWEMRIPTAEAEVPPYGSAGALFRRPKDPSRSTAIASRRSVRK